MTDTANTPIHCDRPMRRNGTQKGKQRWRCNVCGATLTEDGQGKGQPQKYDDNAQKQKVYRERKKMKTEIQNAIAVYESADKDKCLDMVRALIQQFSVAQQFGAEMEVRQIDGGSKRTVQFSPSHTVLNWLTLAEQRLIKETCDPNEIAFVQVLTCLNTALQEID